MGLFRTFLALSVFAWHMAGEDGRFLFNGAFAVLSFYMISGFLMSLTFSQNYQHRESGTRRFFLNRFLRIYPPYLLVILLTILFHSRIGQPDPFLGYRGSVSEVPLLTQLGLAVSNVVIFGMDIIGFLGNSEMVHLPQNARLFGPSWSIACEILFYIGVPWIAHKSSRVLLGLIAVALVLRYMLGHDFASRYQIDAWRYYIAPSTWVFFLLGMLSFRLRDRICSAIDSGIRAYVALAAFGAVLIIAGVNRYGALDSPGAWCYYMSLFAVLPLLWKISKDSVVDDWVGKLSYPIYLLHPLVIAVYEHLFGGAHTAVVRYAIVTTCLLLAACLLYLVVERPIEFVRAMVKQWRSVNHDPLRQVERPATAMNPFTSSGYQMEPMAGGGLPGRPAAPDN